MDGNPSVKTDCVWLPDASQKTQAILGVLTSIFVIYGGKYSVKMCACDLISGYLVIIPHSPGFFKNNPLKMRCAQYPPPRQRKNFHIKSACAPEGYKFRQGVRRDLCGGALKSGLHFA